MLVLQKDKKEKTYKSIANWPKKEKYKLSGMKEGDITTNPTH